LDENDRDVVLPTFWRGTCRFKERVAGFEFAVIRTPTLAVWRDPSGRGDRTSGDRNYVCRGRKSSETPPGAPASVV
jgi:hypothetical protein